MMTTLLYLASGGYNPSYENLPFEQIICVDANKGFQPTYPKQHTKVRFIGTDALFAIDQLIEEQVHIDCLVSMNEGLDEGGGSYPIFSGFLMGYLSPILKPSLLLICDLNRYTYSNRSGLSRLDWGYQKIKEIKPADSNYIDPRLFINDCTDVLPKGQVFEMNKIRTVRRVPTNNNTKVKLIQCSIWDDKSELDFIGLSLISKQPLTTHSRLNINNPADFFIHQGVINIYKMPFVEILRLAKREGAKRIGLGPWNEGDYRELAGIFNSEELMGIESISFYHLNPKDFKDLYQLTDTL
jgi:hypothetical protein